MHLAQLLAVGQVTAEWTTQGKLLPGQLVSGNRTLVYAGPIRAGLLEDTIVLKLQADYIKQQMQVFSEQAKELGESTTKAAKEAATPKR